MKHVKDFYHEVREKHGNVIAENMLEQLYKYSRENTRHELYNSYYDEDVLETMLDYALKC